jgi:hypothetical protein
VTPSQALLDALATLDLAWADILRDAEAIVVFGSRAVGWERPDSDWDLVCVGSGVSRLSAQLDLLWISAEEATGSRPGWVGTELANHVACFGQILVGEIPWSLSHDQQELALARKRRRLEGHVRGLTRVWSKLNRTNRDRQLAELRRDLQRYILLDQCEAVVPTAMLDRMWRHEGESALRLLEWLERANVATAAMERIARYSSGKNPMSRSGNPPYVTNAQSPSASEIPRS